MSILAGRDISQDDLRTMRFTGTVEDGNDPERLGRARVRVHGKFDELSVEDLPWAWPGNTATFGKGGSGQISVPKKGETVDIRFDNGDIYSPIYGALAEPSPALIEEIRGSYEGAQALWFDADEDLKIYYTREKGIEIFLKDSRINIASDNSITIEHTGTQSVIELRGGTIRMTSDSQIEMTAGSRIKASAPEVWMDGKETKAGHVPAYSMVLAEPLFAGLKALAAIVDAKLYPTPGVATGIIEQMEMLATSGTCKVSK